MHSITVPTVYYKLSATNGILKTGRCFRVVLPYFNQRKIGIPFTETNRTAHTGPLSLRRSFIGPFPADFVALHHVQSQQFEDAHVRS